jgi:serine/threonine protein kinase
MNDVEIAGICPHCEGSDGDVGKPCDQPLCERKGYHYIPRDSFMRYQAWLAQPGASEDPEIGKVVDRYLLAEKLGQGGMGAVYLALQMPLMRDVALKMASGVVLDDTSRQRFEREAKAISILYHPNIVGLIDFGFNPATGAPFMAIEFVKGGRELAREMVQKRKKNEAWDHAVLVNIFSQILNGLSIAHKSGLIHRDIKPQNIMLLSIEGNPHFVKILDFGLARALVEIPGGSKLTLQGTVMGTPQYMAPEQVVGKETVDHRCDLYAVGAMLFEMVTSRPLYPDVSSREVFALKMNPDFDPLQTLAPGAVHPELESFLKRALARRPSDRYLSAGEMKEGLIRAISSAGGLKEKDIEDIGFAPTLQMAIPPDMAEESLSKVETRMDMEPDEGLEAEPEPGPTQATGSIEASDDDVFEEKHWNPATITLLVLGLAAAAVIAVFFVIPRLQQGWPGIETEDAAEAGSAKKKKANLAGKPDETEPRVIDLSMPPPELVGKTGLDKKKLKKKDEGMGEDAEAAVPDAGVVPDAPAPVEGSGPAPPPLPQQPPASDVKKARKALKKAAIACGQETGGKFEVSITVVFSGATGGLKDIDGMITPPEAGDCIKKAAADLSLPPFSDEKFSFTIKVASADKPGLEEDETDDEGGGAASSPGEEPSDKDINSALRKKKIRSWLAGCAGDKTGLVKLEVTVDGSTGKVKDSKLVGGDFLGTQEGTCMEKAIEKLLTFPPFGNKVLTFKRQFTLE